MRTAPCFALSLLLLGLAAPAHADNNSWVALGVGAQFGFLSPGVADAYAETPSHQYGLVTRLELGRILGLELAGRLDNDPNTQRDRHLSPRYQLAVLVNVVPTRWFDLYVAAGLGAHNPGDLFDLEGDTTSFHGGPGVEVFIGEHIAVGGDFRFRVAGPSYLESQVRETLSADPVDDLVGFGIWQLDFMVSWYL